MQKLRIAKALHGYHILRHAGIFKPAHFLLQAFLHHQVHSAVDPVVYPGPVIIQDKISKVIGRLPLSFLRIVLRYPSSGLVVEFQRPDSPLDIVGVDLTRGLRIHLLQHAVKLLRVRILLQHPAVCRITVIFRKLDIVDNRLDIEAGTADDDRNMPRGIDLLHRFLRKRLELHDVKGLRWIQDVDQIMTDPSHLLRPYLGRSDIHPAVDLHGIGRDDLSPDLCRKLSGQSGLADCCRTGQYDQLWSVDLIILLHMSITRHKRAVYPISP